MTTSPKLPPVDCTLCENALGRYCVPMSSRHRPASAKVLRGEVWELETIEFMRQHIGDREIVHAGMFFGDFLPGLAQTMAPGRDIYGFEPNPENYACAQWTVLLNGLSNVRMHHSGLGARSSKAFMRVASREGLAMGGGSRIVDIASIPVGDAGITAVELIALDDVLPSTADIGIVQLDLEGYERTALTGAMRTIRRCRPMLILETLPADFVGVHLQPLGYAQTTTVCSNAVLVAN